MIIETSQDTIKIEHSDQIKSIGIRSSGGADSGILTYLLCKYVSEERPDILLVPFTTIHGNKPNNLWYAQRVKWWMKEHFPMVNWHREHFTNHSNSTNYGDQVNALSNGLIIDGVIDFCYSGVTANPPREVWTKFKGVGDGGVPQGGGLPGGLPDDRDKSSIKKDTSYGSPFLNIDKQGIAELYSKFGLLDSLFPITRTCEENAYDPTIVPHCGECVWCQERLWGFGKLN